MNIYDFDNTIYDGDSSLDFYFYSLLRHPFVVLKYFFKTFFINIKYIFDSNKRYLIKENIFSFIKDIKKIDKYIDNFVDKKIKKIKPWYLNNQKNNDVIISASYDLWINKFCKRLGIKNIISTKVSKKTGKIIGKNCSKEEKVKRFKKQFKNKVVECSYSDSKKDIAILEYAKKGYVVYKDEIYQYVDKKSFKRKYFTKEDLIIFLIPIIMFGIYFIVFYPGVLSYDSYYQLNEIKTGVFTSAHPFLHTFYEMILLKIWYSPAIISIFQILLFSTIWMYICKYNRKNFFKKNFLFQVVITIIICLNPLNSTMSLTMWKDVPYSYMVLLLCFNLQKMIDKKFKIKTSNVFWISCLLLVICNLRHNGLIIALGIGLILFILFIIFDKKSKNFIKLAVFMLLFALIFKGLNYLYKVDDSGLSISSSTSMIQNKLIQGVGYIGKHGSVTDEQKNKLNEYIRYDVLVDNSHPNFMDLIWSSCDIQTEKINENKKEFLSIIFEIFSQNKKELIKYILSESAFIWKPIRLEDSYGFIIYSGITANGKVGEFHQPLSGTAIHTGLKNVVSLYSTNTLYQTLNTSNGLYLWLIIGIILLIKKYKYLFVCALPILLNLAGLALTMPANDVRYYYSTILVSYLFIVIFIQRFIQSEGVKL